MVVAQTVIMAITLITQNCQAEWQDVGITFTHRCSLAILFLMWILLCSNNTCSYESAVNLAVWVAAIQRS